MAGVAVSVAVLSLVVVVLSLAGGASQSTENPAGTRHATPGSSPGSSADSSGSSDAVIEVEQPPEVAEPMTPVPLAGAVRGVEPGTSLLVEASAAGGPWTPFPLRPVVDADGRFRTFVELGVAGVHRLRVVDPISDTSSEVLVVRVR